MKKINIKIKKKESAIDFPIPKYATIGSSGLDLYADILEPITIVPFERKLVSCGIYIEMPKGYEAQIRPRSGLALKHGITLLNTPGTIDSDYRGLISVILINLSDKDFVIERKDRIAQMVFSEVIYGEFKEVKELEETIRSKGGFGHTGVR